MIDKKYEVRYNDNIIKSNSEGIIEGTSIRFNSESEIITEKVNGGYIRFNEIMECNPDEVKKVLDNSNIVMLYNHNINSNYGVLARSKNGIGTLKYIVDDEGVHFRFKAKQKDQGLLESIESGDLEGCSFSFRLSDSDNSVQKWEKRSNGLHLRHIYKFEEINDFSIVVTPAYPKTSVSLRFLQELERNESIKVDIKDNKFNNYYNSLLRKYLS